MTKLTKEQLPWLAVVFFAGLTIGALVVALRGRMQPAPIVITPPSPTVTPLPSPSPGLLRVHISGEVRVPDVYELPTGAILRDGINAAGGMTRSAAADLLNLALPLADGMHVHVPALDQTTSEPALIERAAPGTAPLGTSTGELINLNTATLEELDQLPGVGPSTAQKIIDYRQANGPFATIDEIQNVSGIGPAKLEQIRDLVTIE